jgi:hypothetical protein
MSRHVARIIPLLIALGLAACGNPTSPVSRQTRVAPTRSAYDVLPDTLCRNGYNVAQGRCNPE